VSSSLSLNALVLLIGSLISAAHKDENSVSRDFSATTDVYIAAAFAIVAAGAAWAARRISLA
jgi:hypothetical protein